MNCTPSSTVRLAAVAAAIVAATAAATPQLAVAQQQTQPIVVESAPAFETFDKWAGAAVVTVPVPPQHGRAEAVSPALRGGAPAIPFEPMPVVLGLPSLPLLGPGARGAAQGWGEGLNYQGLHAALLLVDAKTGRAAPAPLSTRLKRGQRFRVQLTATFDGIAAIDQVLGPAWQGQRTGQVFPAPGQMVEFKAQQTVTLPLQPGQFFMLGNRPAGERLVVVARHAKAGSAETRSDQPAYRQENSAGSSYLQLVPKGRYPAIEQVLVMGR